MPRAGLLALLFAGACTGAAPEARSTALALEDDGLERLVPPEAREAAAAAREGLRRFLDLIPPGDHAAFGFPSPADLERARLAAPYRTLTLDAAGTGLEATSEWRFPVTVDGIPCALLTVAGAPGRMRAVDLGAAQLARELGALERARAVAPDAARALLRVFALRADFAAYDHAGAEQAFEPLASARRLGTGAALPRPQLLPWLRARLESAPQER